MVDEYEETTLTCYSGPPGTSGVGPCHGGYQICEWSELHPGYSACMSEVAPVPEIGLLACDGIDNDCDGCADGQWADGACVTTAPTDFDVVFFIDVSGSMASTIAGITTAVGGFASTYSTASNIHWGTVVFPGSRADATVEVYQDITDYTTFAGSLASLRDGSGGSEASWDAFYLAATGALGLSFTPGSQHVFIMFTDENGQSYYPTFSSSVPGVNTEATMCGSITDEVVAVFTTPANAADFDDCGVAGSPFPLTASAVDLIANIGTVFGSACGR